MTRKGLCPPLFQKGWEQKGGKVDLSTLLGGEDTQRGIRLGTGFRVDKRGEQGGVTLLCRRSTNTRESLNRTGTEAPPWSFLFEECKGAGPPIHKLYFYTTPLRERGLRRPPQERAQRWNPCPKILLEVLRLRKTRVGKKRR